MTSSTAEVFVDTSGFYASLVKDDAHHKQAREFFRLASRERTRLLTTDHVLDETATLLRRRGFSHLLPAFFEAVLASKACRIAWTDAALFGTAVQFMLKYNDKGWSFTDCLSFVVMKGQGLAQALTSDVHFNQAGFQRLLKPE